MDSSKILFWMLLTVASAGPRVPAADEKNARPPKDQPADKTATEKGEAPWILPPRGYADDLLRHVSEEKDAAGVEVQVNVVPDGYRYLMARGFDDLRKAGYRERELREKIRELHSKHWEHRGKTLFLVTVQGGGGGEVYFLQAALKDHVVLAAGDSKRLFRVFGEDPAPRFASWQVFELPPDAPRKIYRKNLAKFTEIQFSLEAAVVKEGDSTPVRLTVRNLVHITDRRSGQRREKAYTAEGFNEDKRQISTSSWQNQIVPDITLTFYPGRWDFPKAPKEFEEVLERLVK